MSDHIRDLRKSYKDNVWPKYSGVVGLFPIPDYSDHEQGSGNGMWSSAFKVILTTLRYLTPATFLTLFWGQQSLLFRILKHLDIAIKSILYSSDEQRTSVLNWLEEAGPVKVEHLDTVWRHGWILCGVLDSALPGACAGHPPTRLSLKHAQSIADNYLGVEPVFSNEELESIDSLGKRQEWKLAQYLDRIRQALTKLSPPVSKPSSQRTSPETPNFIMDYVARGSGLTAAQINNKMYFKIYPTVQQSLDPGEITVLIRGPKDIYGMTVIPPLLGKAQMIRQKILGLSTQKTENVLLPITQGATYLRAYGKNDMNKTFYIPKTIYDIDIDVEISQDYAKVGYIVPAEGKYDIYITSKGNQIIGSPYSMTASKNIVDILENDSFCLEDGEEIDIIDGKTERKVVLRIVDFVTEKMLLRENGTFEKISENAANDLLSTDVKSKIKHHDKSYTKIKEVKNQKRFKEASTKVKVMMQVCNVFKRILNEKHTTKTCIQNYIPDVVNSTFNENNTITKEVIPQMIIPDSFTLLLQQEKIKTLLYNASDDTEISTICIPSLVSENVLKNKSKEIEDTPIKIIIDAETSDPPSSYLPLEIDRPKTPIFKIISGQCDREDSPFVDPNKDNGELDNDDISNEFVNPFFIHEHRKVNYVQPDMHDNHPATDFIIGAPVSLPPLLKAPSPEPDMDSIILASNLDEALHKYEMKVQYKVCKEHETTIIPVINVKDEEKNFIKVDSLENLTFHSTDSNFDDKSQNSSETQSNSCGDYFLEDVPSNNNDMKSRKETWDSAYVSIDENNSSPESNEQLNVNEMKHKSTVPIVQNVDLFSNMGPAERELWQTCKDLGSEIPKIAEEVKLCKSEFKRPLFTPIIEESDRSLSTGLKDSIGPFTQRDDDSVTLALAELNEILQEYPISEANSFTFEESDRNCSKGLEYMVEENTLNVESASEELSDVMRQRNQYLEESISEVQRHVTESSSASRDLPQKNLPNKSMNFDVSGSNINIGIQRHFGEECHENLVLERKKYWDERIRLIEETKSQQQYKKKKLTPKNLRHNDSLTKRRGKQIVKNFLTADKQQSQPEADKIIISRKSLAQEHSTPGDVKLVKKWKKFWDEKLDVELEKLGTNGTITKTPKENVTPDYKMYDSMTIETVTIHQPIIASILAEAKGTYEADKPPKPEIPEEIFKAFETSPKRFFGTSRKRIMNKIDSFLGKENTTNVGEEKIVIEKPEYENGIVCNRISQFRRITSSEDLSGSINRNLIMNRSKSITVVDNLENKEINEMADKNTHKNDVTNSIELTTHIEFSPKERLANNIIKRLNSEPEISDDSKTKAETRDIITNNPKTTHINNKCTSITSNRKMTSEKLSSSKSEMDIFSKINYVAPNEDLDKHKSCEELPSINVKNVISIYETVSKNSISHVSEPSTKGRTRTLSINDKLPQNLQEFTRSNTGMAVKERQVIYPEKAFNDSILEAKLCQNTANATETTKVEGKGRKSFNDKYAKSKENKIQRMETIITDIDIEIIDNVPEAEKHNEPIEATDDISSNDYKLRFKHAREFFKSFEELSIPEKKLTKMNECEVMLQNNTESPKEIITNEKTKKPKKKVKSHSLPSSEFEKIWSQMQVQRTDEKYVKISEKFNVDDLFQDVVGEGRLSRQGSFKGIPHKKAVLEIFRSMENISDKRLSSYEIAATQLCEFAKQKNIKNAQTYLTEYPYLPTTDPSKYHSRHDTKASGLISRQELLNKPRRNSVPDLRMNANFIVNL